MESEKVKEIKKALEDHSIRKLKYQDGIKIKELDFADILTLINELESENERLKEYRKNHSKTIARIKSENNELKDKIAELKKENKNKTDTITDLLKKQEFYETEKLKQFAERLRYKLGDYDTIRDCVMHKLIDETLKEFINKGDEER